MIGSGRYATTAIVHRTGAAALGKPEIAAMSPSLDVDWMAKLCRANGGSEAWLADGIDKRLTQRRDACLSEAENASAFTARPRLHQVSSSKAGARGAAWPDDRWYAPEHLRACNVGRHR